MRENVSAPTTRAVRAWPRRTALSATESANMNPAQTACTSKAAPCLIPRRACTFAAVAGNVLSGVAVARKRRARSVPLIPALHRARCADPALADTGALANPLIRGIETAREFVIRDNSFRQVGAAPGDLGSHCHRPASREPPAQARAAPR